MIIFPQLRTKRIAVQLREITFGEARAICRLPADRHEATTTEFLKFVASGASQPTPSHITNPRLWTVEERSRLVAHYLSQVSDSGGNFTLGDSARLSDYLLFDRDLPVASVPMGEIAGLKRTLYPLLGVHAEVLERMCKNKGDWLIGVMACQIRDSSALVPDFANMGDVEMLKWCTDSMDAIRSLAESDFEAMYILWERHRFELEHFFTMSVTEEGIVFLPQGKKEAGPIYPARFHGFSCISATTRGLFAGPDQSGK